MNQPHLGADTARLLERAGQPLEGAGIDPGFHRRLLLSHALSPGWVSAQYGDKQAAPALRCSVTVRDADFNSVKPPWQGREPLVELEDCAVLSAALHEHSALRRLPVALDGAPIQPGTGEAR